MPAEDRAGLERLCRYGLRPSFALERLSLLDDGRVRYRLKRPWPRPGGITELVLDPVDFLARLALLIPAPHVNMVRYHGAFAPVSPLRPLLIPRHERSSLGVDAAQAASSTERPAQREQAGRASSSDRGRRARLPEANGANDQRECQHPRPRPRTSSSTDGEAELRYLIGPQPASEDLLPARARRLDWAALLKRVYDEDVLHCPRCAGRLEVIAAISEPSVVAKIFAHLGLPTSLPQPAPARAPPWPDLDLDFAPDPDLELDEDLSARS